ncbi:hypothetical protein [Croceibacterium aestuarii]|uniref:hypothetical protein n=1 Tax=Croceibacterium aestuarii TaxID=3064139 RepID=UPI00272DF060|nr:hypothetical protein [Croceibacterium sp. D39]
MLIEISLPGVPETAPILNDLLGLKVVKRGQTVSGGFDFVALENTELMAVAAVRSRQARNNREVHERALS